MSDTQEDATDFPRVDMSSTSADATPSVLNELEDFIEKDAIIFENSENEVVKEQGDEETHENLPKEKSEIVLDPENGSDGEYTKNEIEDVLHQEKTMNCSEKTNELKEIKIKNEIISDAHSLKSCNATSQLEENVISSEENASLNMKNKISCEMVDNSTGSSDIDQAFDDPQLYYAYDHTQEKHMNTGSDLMCSVEGEETKDEQLPVSLENISKEDNTFSPSTQVLDNTEECNLNNGKDSNILATKSVGVSTEDSPEDDTVSKTMQVSEGTDERSSNSGNITEISELENAGTSFEDCMEDNNVSQSTQISEGMDGNSSSETNSNEVEDGEITVYSDGEASVEEISYDKKSPPKEGRRTSEQVTETISRCLNSEAYIQKLKEIDDIVKQLTAIEFISPHLSSEDIKALEELYGPQAQLEDVDWETYREISESNAAKRKSKESSEFEDEFQTTSKKYKISKYPDSWPLRGEKLCCLEEQFRLACEQSKEDNEGQSQRDKEYKFPVTTGNGEHQGKGYKLCKHQMEKIDAIVLSAMSMEKYLSQLNDEIDNEIPTEDSSSNKISNANPTFSDSKSKMPKSVSSSARTRKFSKKNATFKQKWFHKTSQTKEQFSGVEMNTSRSFGIGKAFNSIKNLILFVSFTGSLTIAIIIAKLFGVTFPVPKSQRNNLNDSKCLLQEFPDINLEEA